MLLRASGDEEKRTRWRLCPALPRTRLVWLCAAFLSPLSANEGLICFRCVIFGRGGETGAKRPSSFRRLCVVEALPRS